MIELRLGAADVARVRFARSPLDELVQSVRVLAGHETAMHHRWVAMARQRLAGLDVSTVDALASGVRYLPDFLMPPPHGWDTTFAGELDRVRHASDTMVRTDLDRCWPDGDLPPVLRKLYDSPDPSSAAWRPSSAPTGRRRSSRCGTGCARRTTRI